MIPNTMIPMVSPCKRKIWGVLFSQNYCFTLCWLLYSHEDNSKYTPVGSSHSLSLILFCVPTLSFIKIDPIHNTFYVTWCPIASMSQFTVSQFTKKPVSGLFFKPVMFYWIHVVFSPKTKHDKKKSHLSFAVLLYFDWTIWLNLRSVIPPNPKGILELKGWWQ